MKHLRSTILPLPKTIFQWLLLVVLSTGPFLFREISGDSLYRIENVIHSESATEKHFAFDYSFKAETDQIVYDAILFEQNRIHPGLTLQFEILTQTHFKIFSFLFLSFFFLLFRRLALPIQSYSIHSAHSPFLLS
jgi:hypothetical protein